MIVEELKTLREVYHDIRNCLLGAYAGMVGIWPLDNVAQL
jgi:hypothetical protein